MTKLWEMLVESDEPPLSVAWKIVMELIDGVKKLQTGSTHLRLSETISWA